VVTLFCTAAGGGLEGIAPPGGGGGGGGGPPSIGGGGGGGGGGMVEGLYCFCRLRSRKCNWFQDLMFLLKHQTRISVFEL
jgi:hypothetical protein